jgi:NDP-sugar pyrophosphorylase family protein
MTASNGSSNGRSAATAHAGRNGGGAHYSANANGGTRAVTNGNGGTKRAVILAGGRGTRLAPYTSILPKPLMPIGDRAILEIVVEQLVGHGFTDIAFSVGYLSHLIRAVFDDRADSNASITYVHEDKALGTAGPLRLVEGLDETFLAMNGDVLTTLDYRALVRHHEESGNLLTIATHQRTVKIDYGVLYLESVDSSSGQVQTYEEKPEISSLVSMGVYVLEPEALEYIPHESSFDIPDLVQSLLVAGKRVGAYTFDGLWFDIGRKDDYEVAAEIWSRTVSENSLECEEALA